jgi:diaminopimelate decarboxylase
VFVNSLGHLSLAFAAGFEPNRIIYAASNMTRAEMCECHAARVHVVLDSLAQVEAFDALARPGTAIGVRVNVGSAIEGLGLVDEPSYRFGLLPHEIEAALRTVRHLRICGVHSYFGTDIMDVAVLLEGLDRLGRVALALPDLAYIDGGGGFGIPDDAEAPGFDIGAYGRGAAAVVRKVEARLGRTITLVIEPGRWLAAPIGWFFTRIVDVKYRPDRIFAGTNASVVQFPRMLIYPDKARHACEIIDAGQRLPGALPVWISGNSTYSRDFLARGVTLPEPRVGNLVAFHHAGAYCRSMHTYFLGKERAREVILDGSTAQVAEPQELLLETVE